MEEPMCRVFKCRYNDPTYCANCSCGEEPQLDTCHTYQADARLQQAIEDIKALRAHIYFDCEDCGVEAAAIGTAPCCQACDTQCILDRTAHWDSKPANDGPREGEGDE